MTVFDVMTKLSGHQIVNVSLILGFFDNAHRIRFNLAQRGLKKSSKSLRYRIPEPVRTL